jgi:4-amino-4-deoxy-L-arabinose transferase-like glycosyltransferase
MQQLPRWIAGVFLCVSVIVIGASIATRTPWWDEGGYADPAVSLVTKGRLGSTVFSEYTDKYLARVHDYTYWMPPFYPAGVAVAFRALGVGVFSIRIYSFAWGLVALVGWYLVGRRLGGSQAIGLLASAVLAMDFTFLQVSANGRPDTMVLGCGSLGLGAYLVLREKNLGRALLAGWTFGALAVCTHPSGAMLACDLLLLIALLDLRRLRPIHAICALLPFLVLGTIWLSYILQAPEVFRQQWASQIGARTITGGSRILDTFTDVYRRYFHYYYGRLHGIERLKILALVFYGAGFLGVLLTRRLRSRAGVRAALALAVTNYCVLANLDRPAFPHYMVMVFAPFALICALWIADALENGRALRWIALGLLALSAGVSVGGHGVKILANGYKNEYLPVLARIKPITDRGGVVVAGSEFAFGVGFRSNLTDDGRLGADLAKPPEAIVFNNYDLLESQLGLQAVLAGFQKALQNKSFALYERPGGRR